MLTRREFLTSGAVATAAVGLAPVSLKAFADSPSVESRPATPSWVDKPTRWAQLTLVEDDPGKFNLQFWLDYFKRTRSDAVCLSAGGCVAYYPTTVAFHHRSA